MGFDCAFGDIDLGVSMPKGKQVNIPVPGEAAHKSVATSHLNPEM